MAILAVALILLVLVLNGRTFTLPGLPPIDLPALNLPNVTIPVTGIPDIQLPNIVVQVTDLLRKYIPATGAQVTLGQRTKSTGCVLGGSLPDSACTPGAVFTEVTAEQICTPGYAASVRDVSQSLKGDVYNAYGISDRTPGQYQVGHLISLQLGGSNDIANLWPEPAAPAPGFREKDRVEDYLYDQICSGKMTLRDAQYQIAKNWVAVYEKIK